jgi:hypothetical protein
MYTKTLSSLIETFLKNCKHTQHFVAINIKQNQHVTYLQNVQQN